MFWLILGGICFAGLFLVFAYEFVFGQGYRAGWCDAKNVFSIKREQ